MKKTMVYTLLSENSNIVKAVFNGYETFINGYKFYTYNSHGIWFLIDSKTGLSIVPFGKEKRKDVIAAGKDVFDKFIEETKKDGYKHLVNRFKNCALIVDYR